MAVTHLLIKCPAIDLNGTLFLICRLVRSTSGYVARDLLNVITYYVTLQTRLTEWRKASICP